MKILLQSLILSAVPFAAFAGPVTDFTNPLPEPETLSLVAIGAVALLVTLFGKRK